MPEKFSASARPESKPPRRPAKERGRAEIAPPELSFDEELDRIGVSEGIENLKNLEIPKVAPKEKFPRAKALIKELEAEKEEELKARPERHKDLEALVEKSTGRPSAKDVRERRQDIGALRGAAGMPREEKVILNIREKIAEPASEKTKLQEKIRAINEQEGRIHHRINEIRENQGAWSKFKGFLAGLTGGTVETPEQRQIAEREAQLENLDAKRNKLMEEMQTLTYREGIRETAGRRRGLAMTPKAVLEEEAVERERKEHREEAKGRYGRNVGKTEEEAEKMYGLTEEKEVVVPKPPKEVMNAAKKYEQETAAMTIEKAGSLVKNAAQLWELANERIKTNRSLGILLGAEGARDLKKTDPATQFVFAIARVIESRNQHADEDRANKAYAKAMDLAEKIGLQNNAAVKMALAESVGGKNVLRGTQQRRTATAQRNARWRT